QNNAETQFQNWYLDIDGTTGDVILSRNLGRGGYWRLTDHGNGIVTFQNNAETQFQNWYLDISVTPEVPPHDRIVIGCISGLFGHADVIGNSAMRNLRDFLRNYLKDYVNPENIFYQSWNPGSGYEDVPFSEPNTGILDAEIQRRSRNPSYLALIGFSYGGWAVSRLSRITRRMPDFIGLIDPVYGPFNSIKENDIPRGNSIKSWYQNYAINELEPCTGATKIPCIGNQSGIFCGNQHVPGAENIHEEYLKNWDGNRERKPCPLIGRVPIHSTHANIAGNHWIWRQISEKIYSDIRNI
ncbi:hypothetical protein PDN02_28445, partial [Bacillus cereus]|nr:hypothetical protein [Bacillus cereus]MDA2080141.1 hypothetical protein [Bacillus cereus]MDA2085666.1 hypothetical protein [Bacillus cereus]